MLLLSGISLLLAYVSLKYVEKPFRQKEKVSSKNIARLSVIGIAVFVALGIGGHLSEGYENRLTEQQQQLIAWKSYPRQSYYLEGTCFLGPFQTFEEFEEQCIQSGLSLIWGDSFAAALASGWRTLEQDVSQLTASSCPPILEQSFSERKNCRSINDFAFKTIIANHNKVIYLHANWQEYNESSIKKLKHTLAELKANGIKDIVILGGVPHYYPSLPDVLFKENVTLEGEHYSRDDSIDVRKADALLEKIALESGVRFESMLDHFCDNGRCISVIKKDNRYVPTAWDMGHLTKEGSEFVSQKVLSTIRK